MADMRLLKDSTGDAPHRRRRVHSRTSSPSHIVVGDARRLAQHLFGEQLARMHRQRRRGLQRCGRGRP
jgi:hypothetical protein